MIDLHCHLCWGVDDGCESREDSVAMARALLKMGVDTVACTPHLRHDKGWVNTRALASAAVEQVCQALKEEQIPLTVHAGSEHYLTSEFHDHREKDEHTFYGQSRYLLLEIPYSGAPADLKATIFALQRARMLPVLAHVERYAHVGVGIPQLTALHEQGCVLQVNVGSLSGAYGREYLKMSQRVLDEGLAHLIAGDCHHPDDPERLWGAGLPVLQKLVGKDLARVMTTENPASILAGRGVQDLR